MSKKTTKTTRRDVERLKENWLSDPCWDIETTEGFEAYRDELYVFRLESENNFLRKQVQKLRIAVSNYVAATGVLREILK